MAEISFINRTTAIRLLCFGIIAIFVCALFSCAPKNAELEYKEDEIAIGEYIARFKNGVQFTLTGLEKAEYDENTVYYNVSGLSKHSNGEAVNVALIIEYNRLYQAIDLHFWGDFEFGLGLDIKRNWKECTQRQDGIKQYSEDEVAEIREKAAEYAVYKKSLED